MHELHALPGATRELLETFLDGEDNTDGLDFVATHGFLTAITVGPRTSSSPSSPRRCSTTRGSGGPYFGRGALGVGRAATLPAQGMSLSQAVETRIARARQKLNQTLAR